MFLQSIFDLYPNRPIETSTFDAKYSLGEWRDLHNTRWLLGHSPKLGSSLLSGALRKSLIDLIVGQLTGVKNAHIRRYKPGLRKAGCHLTKFLHDEVTERIHFLQPQEITRQTR